MGVVTGIFQTPDGKPVANGLYQFKLSQDAIQVSTPSCNCPTLLRGNLDPSGNLSATIIFNDDMVTANGTNTTYQLTIKDVNGGQQWNETYFLTGTAANLNIYPPASGNGPASPLTYLLLENNGTPNGSQNILNLQDGAAIEITDDGIGDLTIGVQQGVFIIPESGSTSSGSETGNSSGTIFSASGAGVYLVAAYVGIIVAGATTTTLSMIVSWNDGTAKTATVASAINAHSATVFASQTIPIYLASGATVNYSITSAGTATYSFAGYVYGQ